MEPMNLLWLFLAGVFFANAVPHGVAGIGGRRFQSPFARPPGVGESSPIVNVLWGGVNLAIGWALLRLAGGLELDDSRGFAALWLGAVLAGVGLAWHFVRVRGGTA
jgi:hypothetical protein